MTNTSDAPSPWWHDIQALCNPAIFCFSWLSGRVRGNVSVTNPEQSRLEIYLTDVVHVALIRAACGAKFCGLGGEGGNLEMDDVACHVAVLGRAEDVANA